MTDVEIDQVFDRVLDDCRVSRGEKQGLRAALENVPVDPNRLDRSESDMHHKFAIFDDRLLLTGSYNWSRSAARENIVVTDDLCLVRQLSAVFGRLWEEMA